MIWNHEMWWMFFQTTETYNAFASFEAPVEGTYFVSVVAVNRAKESSKVVCSDGVIIMPTVPSVKDFVLEGARTRSRLLRDNNGTVWLLDNTLRRHRIENISSSCRYVWTCIIRKIYLTKHILTSKLFRLLA